MVIQTENLMPGYRPLTLTRETEMELERQYSYVTSLKNLMKQSVTCPKELQKQEIFSVLKKTESYMASEVSKLRNKPKKATKYALFMRRIVAMLKLLLNWLPDQDEMEAYPTLGLIITHYLNIILASSIKERHPPKFVATQIYGFTKVALDRDNEYILDVILCSNIADDANEHISVGYYMLCEVVKDHYLYRHDCPTLAKYCAVANILKPLQNGDRIVREASMHVTVYPKSFQHYLETTYKFPKTSSFSISVVIDRIQPRHVTSVALKERLVVVSLKKSNKSDSENQSSRWNDDSSSGTSALPFKSGQGNTANESSFFFDLSGAGAHSNGDPEVSTTYTMDFSSLRDLSEDEDEEEESEKESKADSGSEQIDNDYAYEEDKMSIEEEQEQDDVIESNDEELGTITQRDFEDMFDRRGLSKDKTETDSDVEVLFTDIIPAVDDKGEMEDFDEEGERDLADPESGEDEVPQYNETDYMYPKSRQSPSSKSSESEATESSSPSRRRSSRTSVKADQEPGEEEISNLQCNIVVTDYLHPKKTAPIKASESKPQVPSSPSLSSLRRSTRTSKADPESGEDQVSQISTTVPKKVATSLKPSKSKTQEHTTSPASLRRSSRKAVKRPNYF